MAANEPPTPMKQSEMKSPRMKSAAKSRGPMCQKRAAVYCCWSALMPRYSDAERKVGPSVNPMMYLRKRTACLASWSGFLLF